MITPSAIDRDYAEYRDQYGLITQMRGPHTSANGLRHLAEFAIAKACANDLDSKNKAEIATIARKCMVTPGLYSRWPGDRTLLESTDDYHGLAVISKLCDPTISQEILFYARRHGFYMNNTLRFDKRGFFMWYQQQLVAMHRVAAGESPNFIQKEWIYWTVKTTDFQQDSVVLTSFLRIVVGGLYPIIDDRFDEWEDECRAHYAGGMGQAIAAYFGHPEHPSVKNLWGIFGEIKSVDPMPLA